VPEAKLSALLQFLAKLEKRHIHFKLTSSRPDALMVEIAVPGERWEVEFLEDGSVDVERFLSDGTIAGAAAIRDLFERFSD